MTAPKPLTRWQADNTPPSLPLHIRRNIAEGPGGCWLWTRALNRHGYGWASYRDRTYEAHRIVYLLAQGPISEDLVIDHLCRVRHCVNPAHMEPVTNRENILRGAGCTKPACPQGHLWTDENTHINRRGAKMCRQCGRDRNRARKATARAVA